MLYNMFWHNDLFISLINPVFAFFYVVTHKKKLSTIWR